jgi:hypothetical protein
MNGGLSSPISSLSFRLLFLLSSYSYHNSLKKWFGFYSYARGVIACRVGEQSLPTEKLLSPPPERILWGAEL